MKWRTLLVAILLFSTIQPRSRATTTIPAEFLFVGSGYGHGVGMSQIGARGQALEGKTAREILSHYYPGTEVTPFPDNHLIRVNIANQATSASISIEKSNGGFSVYQGDIPSTENPEPYGKYDGTVTATFTNFSGQIVPFLTSPTAKFAPLPPNQSWTIRWEPNSVIAFKSGDKSGRYKYGQMTFKSITTKLTSYLAVTTTLRLHDEYLYGIGEVPSSWPREALIAQAIASRSYALSKLGTPRSICDCNVYNSISDQSFVGFSKESESIYGKLWKEAVQASSTSETTGQVITLNGLPITAFFFSSSGGQTETSVNAWGQERSFTTSVADPYSQDPVPNPRFFTWTRALDQALVAKA